MPLDTDYVAQNKIIVDKGGHEKESVKEKKE